MTLIMLVASEPMPLYPHINDYPVTSASLVQGRRKHFLSGTATAAIRSHEARKKFFTSIFQLSGLALVAPLCFALHCQTAL